MVKELAEYLIYKNGEIFSKRLNRFLKQSINKKGYKVVWLKIGEVNKCYRVHRILAEVFIDNPTNKPQVNHKDGVKTNNSLDNLEWCTEKENRLHAWKTGLMEPVREARRKLGYSNRRLSSKVVLAF